jgi:peptide/nickel transport system ATP-binding protein
MDLLGLSRNEMRRLWGSRIGMVHQDPSAAVNPSMRIGKQLDEISRVHLGLSKSQAREKTLDMLNRVGMPDPGAVVERYAYQLSGGMLQRVLIAGSLTTDPELLILDEPTTALDVTTEAVILDLLQELLGGEKHAALFITHNLGVVARVCDRVGVMYAGELVEEGPVSRVFKQPQHPYTVGLLGAVPRLTAGKADMELRAIQGYIPRPDELPEGCVFSPRCPMAEDECGAERPPFVEVSPGHRTSCRRWKVVTIDASVGLSVRSAQEQVFEGIGRELLEARDVIKYFKSRRGGRRRLVKAVDGISTKVAQGFTLGIVGESGCGKTTFIRCVTGLEEATSGKVVLQGAMLAPAVTDRPAAALKKMQMVFQNPDVSLNPQHTVGEIIGRPLRQLGGLSKNDVPARVAELLQAVHLPSSYAVRLPRELSGGEKQRVAIARAFAADPALVVCDEPISSVDVSVQAALLNLLADLQRKKGTSYMFVSHDLAAVRHLSDSIVVVYLGRLWEMGPTESIFAAPFHPYTEALLSAIPIADPDIRRERVRLAGSVPSAVDIPSGCRFHTRCPRKIGEICETQEPPWRSNGEEHSICCHIPLEELVQLQQHVLDGLTSTSAATVAQGVA